MTDETVVVSNGIVRAQPEIEINNQGEIIRFPLTEPQHVLGRAPRKSPPEGLIVPEHWVHISRVQATLRRTGDHYTIYDGDGQTPSMNRLFINHAIITPTQGHLLHPGDEITIGTDPKTAITITYHHPSVPLKPIVPKKRSLSLQGRTSVVLGRSQKADLQLDAPTVSRSHAVIFSDQKGHYTIRDCSVNGVFVNGKRVVTTAPLSTGDVITIGPYRLVLQRDTLVLSDQGERIRLDAKDLAKVVTGKKGQKIRILNDISLVIEPGQFVALVGGSGAGKSTLMKSLLGIEAVSQGSVYLNGDDLRKYFNIYRSIIGYVPQSDIVHMNLTVKEVLYYAAKLRLPQDAHINEIIEQVLQQVELTERQDTLVRNLSGGQLKRVSIAVELLSDPKLFFLDEPTSGLDPGLDKKIMQLLRKLADQGRTIVLVTHATTNVTLCDRLVFMGLGGNLCYFGPPQEAALFFGLEQQDFADIYIKLETREAVVQEAERFRRSEFYRTYIQERLIGQVNEQPFQPEQVRPAFWRQLWVLVQRYGKLLCRDPVYLFLSLATAPLGIVLIRLAVQTHNPFVGAPDYVLASLARRVIFVIVCAAVWAGFASSLQEIVKESAIYLRERLVNLGLFAYLGSKVVTLGGLAIVQSLLITAVILIGFRWPPGLCGADPLCFPNYFPWPLGVFITIFLTIVTAVSLGLMVSAMVRNAAQANSALPLLLLPQIVFAGILFDLGHQGRLVSWLMLSRWSVGALGALADVNALVPGIPEGMDPDSIPIKEMAMFTATLSNLGCNWAMLLLHAVVYLGITLWVQKRKDIY
jgi:ABC-type multidrug transport system ATPase subunit